MTAVLHAWDRFAGPTLIGTEVWHEAASLTALAVGICVLLIARTGRDT